MPGLFLRVWNEEGGSEEVMAGLTEEPPESLLRWKSQERAQFEVVSTSRVSHLLADKKWSFWTWDFPYFFRKPLMPTLRIFWTGVMVDSGWLQILGRLPSDQRWVSFPPFLESGLAPVSAKLTHPCRSASGSCRLAFQGTMASFPPLEPSSQAGWGPSHSREAHGQPAGIGSPQGAIQLSMPQATSCAAQEAQARPVHTEEPHRIWRENKSGAVSCYVWAQFALGVDWNWWLTKGLSCSPMQKHGTQTLTSGNRTIQNKGQHPYSQSWFWSATLASAFRSLFDTPHRKFPKWKIVWLQPSPQHVTQTLFF